MLPSVTPHCPKHFHVASPSFSGCELSPCPGWPPVPLHPSGQGKPPGVVRGWGREGACSPSILQEQASQIPAAASCQRRVMRHYLPCSTNPQMNARHLPGSWLIWKHRLQCSPAIRQPTQFPSSRLVWLPGRSRHVEIQGALSLFGDNPREPEFGVHPIEAPQGKEVLLLGVSEWISFPAL